jgi:hypothetical protein
VAGAFIVFGGAGSETTYGDAWLFDLESHRWTEIGEGSGPRPAFRWGAVGVVRDPGGQFVIAGGEGAGGLIEDVWSMGIRQPSSCEPEPFRAGDVPTKPDLWIWPSPSMGDVTIGLSLGGAAHLRVAVYDVRGRLIKTLHNSRAGAGYELLHWRGVDSAGERVASGVYFCTISFDGRSFERPVVVLR